MLTQRQLANGAAAAALAMCFAPSDAIDRGRSLAGYPYTMGGVDQDDFAALTLERRHYSLCLITLAQGSGDYLADVKVRITGPAGRALAFHRQLSGAWLLIDLPSGTYRIEATLDDQRRVAHASIDAAGVRRRKVLYFDAPAGDAPSQAPA